ADLLGPALATARAGATARRRKGQGRHYRLAPGPHAGPVPDQDVDTSIERLDRWGLKTLADLARLPAAELSSRLGDAGLVLQRAARGEDERPLVPAAPGFSFLQSMRLEWPVDDLQPLAFIVSGLCESLEQALARADRGAVALTTMLRLVTPGDRLTGGGSLPGALAGKVREYHALSSGLRNKAAYARTLTLPAPMRDARVLRTLVMLDLESHPPGAAVDEVVIDVDVTPGRILQTGLFEPALPAPEALSTLVARLGALAGASRVGAPSLVDTHSPGAFEVKAFAPHAMGSAHGARLTARDARTSFSSGPEPAAVGRAPEFLPAVIRRFRPPRAARVRSGTRGPERVDAEDIRGDVTMAAGPWRASGGWWAAAWDRDEWDVALDTGLTCRLAQDRATGTWVVDGVLD
ncbi:MAG: hypothetical protein M3Q55_11910, partial [Acidobacteriota bacterium]|nr:hypothetical protein [Acidobacteriota bacterium]